jgi:hypothetical protein
MPTVLRLGPYRFFFYSADVGEPPHVHIERDDRVAKFWIDPVRLAAGGRFNRAELGEIERLVTENQPALLEAWHGFFAG